MADVHWHAPLLVCEVADLPPPAGNNTVLYLSALYPMPQRQCVAALSTWLGSSPCIASAAKYPQRAITLETSGIHRHDSSAALAI